MFVAGKFRPQNSCVDVCLLHTIGTEGVMDSLDFVICVFIFYCFSILKILRHLKRK